MTIGHNDFCSKFLNQVFKESKPNTAFTLFIIYKDLFNLSINYVHQVGQRTVFVFLALMPLICHKKPLQFLCLVL